VTNLNDTAPDPSADAVSATTASWSLTSAGIVNLQSAVSVKSNLTIAGQTGPGDGIGVMAGEVSFNAAHRT